MSRESREDKALRYIREGRVRVLRANEGGIAADIAGTADPATLQPRTYRAMLRTVGDSVQASCTCEAVGGRCSHLTVLRWLWRP